MTAQASRAAARPGAAIDALVPRMTQICGPDGVITDPLDLATYECDGLTAHRCSPGLVVLPTRAEQVAAIVSTRPQAKIPFRARRSGPGLPAPPLPPSH